MNVAPYFTDPDGDTLTYSASSNGSGVTGAADAVAVLNATGPAALAWRDRPPRVTLTGVGEGTAAIRVTATDPGRLSAKQHFRTTVALRRRPSPTTPSSPE